MASEQGAHTRKPTRTASWQALHMRSGTLIVRPHLTLLIIWTPQNMIEALEGQLNGLELPSSGEKAYPAEFIFELLSKACISE